MQEDVTSTILTHMSLMTYRMLAMAHADKPIVWLHGEIKTPPFSAEVRIQAGMLLRRLQRGERVSLPASRPMPIIGRRCHELRIVDADQTWRVIYRTDADAVVIAGCLLQEDGQDANDRH